MPSQNEAMDAAHVQQAQKLINGGIKCILDSRDKDGGWSIKMLIGRGFRPAATAMAIKTLVQHPDFGPKNAIVVQGYKVLLGFQQKDGSICTPSEGVNNYQTCLGLMALAASGDPQYKDAMAAAVKYLRSIQILPGGRQPGLFAGTVREDDPRVGGVNYGGLKGTPDLSNLGMWVDAMHDAGVKGDDPAMQRALDFVTRLQNRSESNSQKFAVEGTNDGGFVYSLDKSAAGSGENGKGLRSYGSMSYSGFKSMLYAGVAKDDPRVKAAYAWIRQYWGLDANPNMPGRQSHQGLYYYYQVFAKRCEPGARTRSRTPAARRTTGARNWWTRWRRGSRRTVPGRTTRTAGRKAAACW